MSRWKEKWARWVKWDKREKRVSIRRNTGKSNNNTCRNQGKARTNSEPNTKH